MGTKIHLPIPLYRGLHKLGSDISDARRRRRITMELLAERAGISRGTLIRIEHGDPGTSLGAYASVLYVLGFLDRLTDLADVRNDTVGLRLVDEELPKRVRLPSKSKK